MKNFPKYLVVLSLFLVSCVDEKILDIVDENSSQLKIVSVAVANGPVTRAPDGYTILESGSLGVYKPSTGMSVEYQYDTTASKWNLITKTGLSDFYLADTSASYYAWYPYAAGDPVYEGMRFYPNQKWVSGVATDEDGKIALTSGKYLKSMDVCASSGVQASRRTGSNSTDEVEFLLERLFARVRLHFMKGSEYPDGYGLVEGFEYDPIPTVANYDIENGTYEDVTYRYFSISGSLYASGDSVRNAVDLALIPVDLEDHPFKVAFLADGVQYSFEMNSILISGGKLERGTCYDIDIIIDGRGHARTELRAVRILEWGDEDISTGNVSGNYLQLSRNELVMYGTTSDTISFLASSTRRIYAKVDSVCYWNYSSGARVRITADAKLNADPSDMNAYADYQADTSVYTYTVKPIFPPLDLITDEPISTDYLAGLRGKITFTHDLDKNRHVCEDIYITVGFRPTKSDSTFNGGEKLAYWESMSRQIHIRQYPPVSVSAFQSAGNVFVNGTGYSSTGDMVNSALRVQDDAANAGGAYNNFLGTVKASSDGEYFYDFSVLSFSDYPGGKMIGDARNHTTVDVAGIDELSNYMRAADADSVVAPGFMVSSGQGESEPVGNALWQYTAVGDVPAASQAEWQFYSDHGDVTTDPDEIFARAEERCAAYQEDGFPAGRWRLPSEAEMRLMIELSNGGYIPQLFEDSRLYLVSDGGGLLVRNGQAPSKVSHDNIFNDGGTYRNSYVRCVYDTWYYGLDRKEAWKTSPYWDKDAVGDGTASNKTE
jgi:hypothetical protein